MPIDKQKNAYIILPLSAFIAVDLFVSFAGASSKSLLVHSACTILSLVETMHILLPPNLLKIAQQQCPDNLTGIGAGVCFLGLKILIAGMLAVGAYCFNVFTRLDYLKHFNQLASRHGGIPRTLVLTFVGLIGISLFLIIPYFNFDGYPQRYRSDIVFKLWEDFYCLLSFIVFLSLLQFPTICFVLLFRRKPQNR